VNIGNSNIDHTFDINTETLKQFRYRNLLIVGWASIPFLIPFSINSFIQGRYLVGLIIFLLSAMALLNAYSIPKHNRIWAPFWCFFLFTLFALLVAIPEVGSKTLFWCYPFLFLVNFIEERKKARFFSALAFLTLVPTAFVYFEYELVVRFTLTLFMLFFFSDILIGALTKLQSNMNELANRDPLTNAFNRRYMVKCMENVIEESKRGFGDASLVMLDLDFFKRINDELGHEAGDHVLISLVELLHLRQRKLDYVFRLGGEEFVILLRNTSSQQAMSMAESLRKKIEDKQFIEGQSVTASFGVAEYISGETADDWFKRADNNLYEAKKLGRNRVHPIIVEET
jgi:diguanylate cyclase